MALTVDSFQLIMEDFLPGLKKIEEILSIIGLLYIGKITIKTLIDIVVGLRTHVFSKICKRNFVEKYGKWAVVTGCTDGIGKAYAFELAKEGLSILLISRNMDKLRNVSAEIEEKFGVETEIVQIDFSDGRELYPRIAPHLLGKDIGVLVNNVGVMYHHPMELKDASDDDIWNHINVNMGAVVAMTKLILPSMLSKGKGAIVNIASIAAAGPIPLLGIYSASKAFVDYFSTSLYHECKGTGVTIQTVNPSYVATNMTSFSKFTGTPSFLTPTASVFARHAVATIGHTSRTNGYWLHGIKSWMLDIFVPRWLFIFLMHHAHKFIKKDSEKLHNH